MAQLNPNFEIDFNDINSYEQIQLINDTQLAKENLLMHRAYKEPADDAIIRNQFSSFTFVDFCPKLFSLKQSQAVASGAGGAGGAASTATVRHYELETFSDLFERINVWLKLNKDWRVVSMETLVYDCTSQFNHLKSSIHANYLPRNTRGLRLFLSPSKSRFSGPQKVGCINVVPRKVSGKQLAGAAEASAEYETLGQILARLNELLLTRPIEGRILSVETVTLPMVNGYVNTETNYFMDNRLNLLNQRIYSLADVSASQQQQQQQHTLIDILRVYYEFGPMVCGLVNLIDFVPRFYATVDVADQGRNAPPPPPAAPAADEPTGAARPASPAAEPGAAPSFSPGANPKITATESMTRLVRRSLSWFEAERARVLSASLDAGKLVVPEGDEPDAQQPPTRHERGGTTLNLKLCNLQIHSKTMLKNELLQVRPANALERIQTRRMIHERRRRAEQPAIVCQLCEPLAAGRRLDTEAAGAAAGPFRLSSSLPQSDWCAHLVDLAEPYELRFVRLAYIVPVSQTRARIGAPSLGFGRLGAPPGVTRRANVDGGPRAPAVDNDGDCRAHSAASTSSSSSSNSSGSNSSTSDSSPATNRRARRASAEMPGAASESGANCSDEGGAPGRPPGENEEQPADEHDEAEEEEEDDDDDDDDDDDEGAEEEDDEVQFVEKLLAQEDSEELSKQWALDAIRQTNERHGAMELAHQLQTDSAGSLDSSPVGQLTYRLFAPCQLVNSSSCFAINPVNSSNPLARRGSVDLNGAGQGEARAAATTGCLSSENAQPASLLLGPGLASQHHHNSQVVSFGAFFPALASHDLVSAGAADQHAKGSGSAPPSSRFTTNEFEAVEAIRRRMEIYVTTNSMKVLAGETLIINLSDHLSCLSTAIEQTVVRAPFARRAPSTWVSVYILYAAVEEPAKQLLEHQRRLAQISEEEAETEAEGPGLQRQLDQSAAEAEQAEPVFEDDFKSLEELRKYQQQQQQQQQRAKSAAGGAPAQPEARRESLSPTPAATATVPPGSPPPPTIRIEQNPSDESLTLYNSAYDRTVALPTQPDNQLSHYLEPNEFLAAQDDCLWLDENDLIEAQHEASESRHEYRLIAGSAAHAAARQLRDSSRKRGKTYRKTGSKSVGRRKLGRRRDSQCSVM